jgi:Suppressor of fused protein (SUFU)
MTHQQQVIKHYETVWNNKAKIYLFDKGQLEKLPYDFRVLEFPPTKERNMWTYSTCCMSDVECQQPIELHIFSSIQDESIIELLTSVVYYHRNNSKLGLNHTIYFGRPWQNQSSCEYGFISLPYLDGPILENMKIKHKQIIKFYWLIPITKDEKEFKISNSAEALEIKFDQALLDYINPNRHSTV